MAKVSKKSRRPKGTGGITQRKDGTYMAQYTVGKNVMNGKTIRKTIYGKSKVEVEQKLNQIINDVYNDRFVDPSSITLSEYILKFIERRKPFIDAGTYRNHCSYANNHIIPDIGHLKLKQLNAGIVQDFVNSLMVKQGKTGRGKLGSNTIIKIYQVLDMALSKAAKEKLIKDNITGDGMVELPKNKNKSKVDPLTSDEMNALLDAAKGNKALFMALLLESVTGLRGGELLGLRWDVLNFKENTITIKSQILPNGIEKGLKTESSYRTITLDASIITILRRYKTEQQKIKLLLGKRYQDNNLIICHENGAVIPRRTFHNWFKTTLSKAGLREVTIHTLRHTFVTLGIEQGLDFKTLMSLTGHSSISTFFGVYSHFTPKMQQAAAVKIAERVKQHTGQ